AHIFALVPRSILVILLKYVVLLPSSRIMGPLQVEMRCNRAGSHDRAKIGTRISVFAIDDATVGFLYHLVGTPRIQPVILHVEREPLHAGFALLADEGGTVGPGDIDDGLLEIPLALHQVLADGVGLDVVDRISLARTASHRYSARERRNRGPLHLNML